MALEHDETLQRIVRKEPWQQLAASTYQRIREAIQGRRYSDAVAYLDYFHDEALVCRRLYDQWLRDTLEYLRGKGLSEKELESELARISAIIALPGRPADRELAWTAYLQCKAELGRQLRAEQAERDGAPMLESLRLVKEAWRVAHDLDVDVLLGLFDVVVARFGEAEIGEMWEKHLVRQWFEERYARFDLSKNDWRESFRLLVFLSFEAMHGHLCGPNREGDVEYREFEDRVELAFDPCGSGGRAYRGEPLDGTGSRMEAPYGFKALQGAYDFTWNKSGICTYCVHCCVLTEKLPAKVFGYPVRIIDPPSYPHGRNAKCRYTIYKDPRAIPAHIYERIGLRKPSPDRELGSAHGPFTG